MGKFYIENERNEQLDLQSREYQIIDVTGLGITNQTGYTKVGMTFLMDYMDLVQNELSFGVVMLPPHAHEKLQSFYSFINGANSLCLIYEPSTINKVAYRRDIDVVGVMKDTNVRGLQRYNLSLKCKSLFYIKDGESFLIDRASGEMRYDYTFPARFNDNAIKDIVIKNSGHVPAAMLIELEGYTDTPRIQVFVEGKEVFNLSIAVVIQIGERLRYCTRDGNLEISLINKDGQVKNLIAMMDLSTEVFFQLPLGISRVQFTSDKGILSKIHFNAYKYYKVV